MTWLAQFAPALLEAGGSVAGGVLGAQGASAQAKAQKKIYKKQLQFAKDIYGQGTTAAATALPQQQQYLQQATQQALGYQQPYAALGTSAGPALTGYSGADPALAASAIEAFKQSPMYQLNYQALLDQATKAVQGAAAAGAGGGFNTGSRLEALTRLGPSILGPLYQDYINQLTKQTGMGQQAAQTSSTLAGNLGVNQANTLGSYVSNLIDLGKGVVQGANPAYSGMAGAAGTGAMAPYAGAAYGISGAAQPLGQVLGQYYTPQPQPAQSPYAVNANPYQYGGPR